MPNEDFTASLEEAKWKYTSHVGPVSQRAYEYGVLVVKNAFLVSGGGLFFIPAIAGLSDRVNLETAASSGAFFACSLLLSLVGNYIVHLNWMSHETLWANIYELEKIYIRRAFEREFQGDVQRESELLREDRRTRRFNSITFWVPHLLVVAYLGCICAGGYYLYASVDISIVFTQ